MKEVALTIIASTLLWGALIFGYFYATEAKAMSALEFNLLRDKGVCQKAHQRLNHDNEGNIEAITRFVICRNGNAYRIEYPVID